MWIIALIVAIVLIAFVASKVIKNTKKSKENQKHIKEYNQLLSDLPEKSDSYIQGILNTVANSMIMRKSMIERGVVSVDTMECKYPQYKCQTYGEVYNLQQKALKIKKSREKNK